jgi:hypothetical protein
MRLRSLLALASSAMLLAGCATRFVNVWKSPEWSGPPLRSVLVLGNTPDPLARRSYEDAMAESLRQIGVRADSSYRTLPGARFEREEVANAVAMGGHDGLIAARLLGVDQRETYVPAGPGPAPGPYLGWRRWGGFYEPGYVRIDQVARIETQVWSLAGDGTMIWAGSSETVNPREIPNLAKSLADETVGTLQQAGILPQ